MKKSIIIPLLLISMFAFAQVNDTFTTVKFNLDKDGTVTTDPKKLPKLKLPIKFIFDAKFQGKTVKITSIDNTPLAPKVVKFGDENLQKDGLDNSFRIEISKERTVNPGDNDKINVDSFLIQIEQNIINLTLTSIGTTDGGSDETKKDEEYEAGYIYYDAMKLFDKNSDPKLKMKILGSYGIDVNTVKNNPYLNDVFSGLYNKGLPQGGLGGLIGNLGNTDVTFLAAGLSKFLAERTKEELNEAFFNKMKEQLSEFPELKTAFPKTVSYLDKIETYAYASILNALKDAFEMDMQNLPENLYNIKSLTVGDCEKISICGKDEDCDDYNDCQERLKKLTEFFTTQDGHWVALSMFSIKEGIKSTNPADLLKSIAASTEFTNLKSDSTKFDDYNIASSIELSNLISQSLVSIDDKQVWISKNQLNSLFNSKAALKIYFGLLLSKELSTENKTVIKFYYSENNKITFGDILKKAHQDYAKYEPQVSSLIKNTYAAYNAANNAVKKMIAASEKSVEADPQSLYDYYRTLTSSLKPVAHSPLLIALVGKDIGASYDKVEKFLNPSVDIAYHISTKKYSAAIYDASILLSALNELKVTTKDKKGNEKEEKYDGFKTVTKSFEKYGTLISTVANAQSSEEVKYALDASVLPVGSYSIKQNSRASLNINSYVGAYYSFSKTESIPVTGLIAPIAFNFSQGVKKDNFFNKYLLMGGYSINLQLLDLGALVNYYLIKGDTATIPNDFNIKLSNIFSPGFSLHYNLKKVPLSIALGRQYIPTIYKYQLINGKNELTTTNAWRWQVSLLVDIPLYNLKVWDFKK